jgi:ribulose 1,5-bisphosphate carboxylase large subunit-like protein
MKMSVLSDFLGPAKGSKGEKNPVNKKERLIKSCIAAPTEGGSDKCLQI